MARFSVSGDDDANEERPRNNRPSPKRRRLSVSFSNTYVAVGVGAPSASNSAAAAGVQRPEEPVAVPDESDRSSDGSENSWSDHTSTESEYDSEEEELRNVGSGNEVQSTAARVDPASNGNGPSRELEGGSGVSLTLRDPDVLDCPICFEPLCSPVYQCENGHIACASCCTKLKNKCGSCCLPIGYNRCRAMEKVLDSIRIPCRNMPYGCPETLTYSKKQDHEKTCNHIPCTCPYVGCDYVAISKCVYSHFAQKHPHSPQRFIFNSVSTIILNSTQKKVCLQDLGKSTLFVLHRSIEAGASFINVVCIGPTSEKKPFLYELTAVAGESSIKLKTFVNSVPKWTAESPKKICLVVPRDFTSNNELRLELIIRRNPQFPGNA